MERFYRWSLPASALVATCLGVFVLPFFFPPPYLQGISLANIAGFNNKVSWAAAAAVSLAVFLLALRWPWLELRQTTNEDRRPLSLRFRLVTTLAVGILIAGCSALIAYSGYRYNNDAYYFIHQISMHTDYGRALYDQIEFPYGPLLFYSPIVVRTLLSPFHVSAVSAYFTTLVLFQTTGMLLLGWMLNHLPIRHCWRAIFYLVLAVHAVQPCFGLNYTYLRFSTSAAILLFAALQRSPWKLAAALFFGQFLSLALSPEMGFAFLAAGMGLAVWNLYTRGASYLPAVAAPVLATPVFVLIAGTGYVRMLGLFAKGVFNFPVEPLPHVLVFLFAFVWLVPPVVALSLRRDLPQASAMAALYLFCIALLPVAFGRSDPGHVILNEIPLFMLSLVAISRHTPVRQRTWITILTVVLLWGAFVNLRIFQFEYQVVIRHHVFQSGYKLPAAVLKRLSPRSFQRNYDAEIRYVNQLAEFDLSRLQAIVGKDPVATPSTIPLQVEQALRDAGQFTPSFYCFGTAILDRDAELRQVEELNHSRWMMTRDNPFDLTTTSARDSAGTLGLYLPYPQRHIPYIVGRIFAENLKQNWELRGRVGEYDVYRRHDSLTN